MKFMSTKDFICMILFFVTFLMTLYLVSIYNLKKTQKIINSLDLKSFIQIEILFMEEHFFIQGGRITNYISANLYLGEDVLIITPKRKPYINLVHELPIILANDIKKIKIETANTMVFKPTSFSITSINSVIIEYKKKEKLKHKIRLTIKPKNKEEIGIFKIFNFEKM